MLWGRVAESSRLRALIDDARDGRSGSVCVRGEPGIGKTSLLEDAASYASDCQVLRASGVQAESALAFAGLFGLVYPLVERIDELPEASAVALRAALGLGAPVGAERFAVGAATLGLLSIAAEARPVVCLIDDLHWLDAGSRDALLFATRRLGPEGIAVILGLRDPEGEAIDTRGIADLRLGGLDAASAQELLNARGRDLAEPVVHQLTDRCAGNPLALVEVAAGLSEQQRRGLEPLGPILPVGPEVSRSYRARLDGLTQDERIALLTLALQEDQDPAVLRDALEHLGLTPASLDAPEESGLVSRVGGLALIVHPLARAVVVAAAAPADLRRVHNALGEAHDDPERRAWHLALAADGPDENAAAELERIGGFAIARGDPLTASRALTLSATLSPERHPRSRRYLAAGQMAAVAGVPPFELLDQATATATASDVADEATVMRAAVLAWTGDRSGLQHLLDRELDAVERRAPDKAAMIHGLAVNAAGTAADLEAMRTHGRAAARLWGDRPLMGDPRSLEMVVQTGAAVAELADDDPAAARRRLEACVLLLETGAGSVDIAGPLGASLVSMGELALARRAFRAAGTRAQATGQLAALAWQRILGAILGWAEGDLRECAALTEEGQALGSLCGNVYATAVGSAMSALVSAARDDADGCARAAGSGMPVLERLQAPWISAVYHQAHGLLALNAGRLDQAERELRTALTTQVIRAHQPVPSDHDLVEVLVRTGSRSEAAALADSIPTHGAFGPRAIRSRALVAEDESEAELLFQEALHLHHEHGTRLEHGRTHLLHGERLRRGGRRAEGRAQLEAGLHLLEGLGAEGFAKRARAELRACGVRPRRHDLTARDRLTGQERQVTQEVALGRSNREVAAALFLSPKTVEMHLTRVYRKLGLRSRAELVRLVAHGGLDGAPEESATPQG